MSLIRIHYHFVGRVQGVGFRYTAYYAATRHGVTGFVKNEDDGSVTMEAQGSPQAIMAMMRQIKESRSILTPPARRGSRRTLGSGSSR